MPKVKPRLTKRHIGRHVQRQQRDAPDQVIEQQAQQPCRDPPGQGVERRLPEHHAKQIPGSISHGLQCRILRQLVGKIGIGHLIRDQHPDDKADDRAHRKDRPRRGHVRLKLRSNSISSRLGEHRDRVGQRLSQRLLDGGRIFAGTQLDDPDIDRRLDSGGPRSRLAKVRSLIITVPSLWKSGPSAKLPTILTLRAVELGFRRAAVHAEKAPGAAVDQHRIRFLQFLAVGVHVGIAETPARRGRSQTPGPGKPCRRTGSSRKSRTSRRKAAARSPHPPPPRLCRDRRGGTGRGWQTGISGCSG